VNSGASTGAIDNGDHFLERRGGAAGRSARSHGCERRQVLGMIRKCLDAVVSGLGLLAILAAIHREAALLAGCETGAESTSSPAQLVIKAVSRPVGTP
jgi:hypothetical protein